MAVTAQTERGAAVAELVNEVMAEAGIPGLVKPLVNTYIQTMVDSVDRDPGAARRGLAPFVQRIADAFGFGPPVAAHIDGRPCCDACDC